MSRIKEEGQSITEFVNDFAITPLGIPIICGPGAITVTIVLFNDTQNITERFIFFGIVVLVLLITFLFLVGSRKILRFLGENGNKVLMRIMGLILMVIAVELMFSGLKPIIQEIIRGAV
jgi:multiple antibiotic resistance protein